MKVKSKVTMVPAILGVVMAMVLPAISQDMPADNMKFVYEKIRADKKLFVAENMQITDEEAKAFWPVYDRYQDELFLLRARTLKMIQDYAGSFETMTNEAAKNLLEEYMTIEALGLKLRQDYLPRFQKVLPEAKVVRYFQIENKIQAVRLYELAAKIPLVTAAN